MPQHLRSEKYCSPDAHRFFASIVGDAILDTWYMNNETEHNLPVGATIWFTGPPASGKRTLATRVYQALLEVGLPSERLDGPEIKTLFWPELDFSDEDAKKGLERLAGLSRILNRHGVTTVVTAISPFEDVRRRLRESLGEYVEIYCCASLEARMQRDGKGLDRRAHEGSRTGSVDDDSCYEEPKDPDITVYTDREPPEASVEKIVTWLAEMGYLTRGESLEYTEEEAEEVRKRLQDLGYI